MTVSRQLLGSQCVCRRRISERRAHIFWLRPSLSVGLMLAAPWILSAYQLGNNVPRGPTDQVDPLALLGTLSASPASIDFGSVPLGNAVNQTMTLRITGV